MKVIRSISQLRETLKAFRKGDKTIGFVPTMGFLHEGHLSLVDESKSANSVTVVSIFVNPLQFNSSEDLEKYPRNEEKDVSLLENLKVDVVFIPLESEVYREKLSVKLLINPLEDRLEGHYRPGHFNGVGVIVTKLLNYVQPDRAYFGLKDLQQFIIIKRIVSDLSIPVEVIGVPTVRSSSGLALSSRNSRLSENGLIVAEKLYEGLCIAREQLRESRNPQLAEESSRDFFNEHPEIELEYFEVIDTGTFNKLETFLPDSSVAICVAAYVEGIRLIDNLYLRPDSPE